MIRTLVKHWIYERCIDIFFETVERNFSEVRKSQSDIIREQIQQILENQSKFVNQSKYGMALGASRVFGIGKHINFPSLLIKQQFPSLIANKI